MKLITGDLFKSRKADAICIPINCEVKKDGTAVMGAGVARRAAELMPALPAILGEKLRFSQHKTMLLTEEGYLPGIGILPEQQLPYNVVVVPTKFKWRNPADLVLLTRSVRQLVSLTEKMKWRSVVLPKIGCGLGGLNWENQVQPLLNKWLDDRFYIICLPR